MEYLIYFENTDQIPVDQSKIVILYKNFVLARLTEEERKLIPTEYHIEDVKKKGVLQLNGETVQLTQLEKPEDVLEQEKSLTWILQFKGPVKKEWRFYLEETGIPTYSYLEPYSIYIYGTAEKVRSIDLPVEHLRHYPLSLKLRNVTLSTSAAKVVIRYFPWAKGVRTTSEEQTLEMALQKIDSELVELIQPRPDPVPRNAKSRQILKVDLVNKAGFNGTGEVLGVSDTGVFQPHEAFQNGKIIKFFDYAGDANASSGDGDGHGTHVAGTIAGDAPATGEWNKEDGQGFGSKLVCAKVFNNRGGWALQMSDGQHWRHMYEASAKAINNSWGSDSNGAYGYSDQEADDLSGDLRALVLCVANGNEGPGASTCGSPAVAKDVISVGASRIDDPEEIANFSSRGPTRDGRIKPDIVAPGVGVRSAKYGTTSGYWSMDGTSMAAPQITGLVGVLRQYLKTRSMATPSSALIKALLINGAVEMKGTSSGGTVPNNIQGWGRADLARSIGIGRTLHLYDQLTGPETGGKWVMSFDVTAPADEIKVTLVWIDPPGSNLINNYNLTVRTPNNVIFYGNNFTGRNPSYSIAGGSLDGKNNVEGVHLVGGKSLPTTLPSGKYSIEVYSSQLVGRNNGFAVVAGVSSVVIPPANKSVAILGDYNGQLAKLVPNSTSFPSDKFSDLLNRINDFSLVIVNNSTTSIRGLYESNANLLLLGNYPLANSGLGRYSEATKVPAQTDAKWNDGDVRMKILVTSPLTNGFNLGDKITLVNGGDRDYQSFDNWPEASLFGKNVMGRGLPFMAGVRTFGNKHHVIHGSLGVSNYTNTNHWTADGRKMFDNAVKFLLQ